MLTPDFLRNAWYVAGLSETFGHHLTPLRILGEDLVFFRRNDGSVAALEDACPHRKLPLSNGSLDGDRVICGYHGLTFDGAGVCVAAPTQPDAIPRRARVASQPTAERYGFVWVWMGQGEPGPLIDIAQFDNPSWGRTDRGAMDIACHYLWVMDNLLDPSHVAWVHLTSFAGAGTDNTPLTITETEDGLIVWRWILDTAAPPYYAPFLDFAQHCDRKQHYECRLPSVAINKSVYTPAGTAAEDGALPADAFVNYSYNFMTPVDADNTRYFWFQHRNSRPEDHDMSARMFAGATMAFNEDKDVLERVHLGMKAPRTPYLNLGLDAGAMRFRLMTERQVAVERAAASG